MLVIAIFLIFSLLNWTECTCGVSNGYSDQQEQMIVKYHNNFRSTIAKGQFKAKGKWMPAAANMQKMNWDCTVEKSAKNWALRNTNCDMVHSNGDYGENLYWYSTTEKINTTDTLKIALDAWTNEFQQSGWSSLTFRQGGPMIGHGTQMAWWNSNKIGCGYRTCYRNNWNYILIVCQYDKAGNWYGQPAYESGATCSDCGKGFSCQQSTGLCV